MNTSKQTYTNGEEVSRRQYKILDDGMFPVLVCKEEGYWVLDQFDRRILTRAEWLEIRANVDAFYDTYSDEAIAKYNEPAASQRYSETAHAPKTVKPAQSGYIYLICGEETSWYKIGQSKSPKIRLKQLGTQGPFRCRLIHSFAVADMDGTESLLHEQFSSKRAQGEWFNLGAADLEWFATFVCRQEEATNG